jgi:uncharacterized protein RhaS with RHS repeats
VQRTAARIARFKSRGARSNCLVGNIPAVTRFHALNRKLTHTIPTGGVCGAAPANTLTDTYDLGGRKTGISDTLGNNIALTNDTAGQLIATATMIPGAAAALATNYTLDANGNRIQLKWPDGYYANYTYDFLNRMTWVSDSNITTLATYAYDLFSRRTSVTYGNNAAMAYTYSTAGDLLTLGNTLNAAANNVAYTLGYTNAHQLASEATSILAYEFAPSAGTDSFAAVNTQSGDA